MPGKKILELTVLGAQNSNFVNGNKGDCFYQHIYYPLHHNAT
jgi:hypothetical protein